MPFGSSSDTTVDLEEQISRAVPVNTNASITISGNIKVDDGRTEVDVQHLDTIAPAER